MIQIDYGNEIQTRRLINNKIIWINDVEEMERVENFEYDLKSILNKEDPDKNDYKMFDQ